MSRFPRFPHAKSRELYERALGTVAGGVSSQVRAHEPAEVPLFFESAKDGRMRDVDGNEYVDYVMGMGPNLFGHAPDFIANAVSRCMEAGVVFAGQFELELELAELALRLLPFTDGRVRFASSGTEIDQIAIRLMRGFTGRPKFIKFEGHYHGWVDNISYSFRPGLNEAGASSSPVAVPESQGMDPAGAANVVVCEWNDLDRLAAAFDAHAGEIAGVLMEPIAGNANAILPHAGYLEGAKALCEREGALLCFDEVITGFRVAAGGAAELLGVTPHLATYGKALAGGFPLSMLAGEADVMARIGDGTVFHGGTFNSNMMAVAAAHAALARIDSEGRAFYERLTAKGHYLMEGLARVARESGVNLHVQGPGPFFGTSFTDAVHIANWREHARHCDEDKHRRFAELMLGEGVRLAANGRVHMASAHSEEDLALTLRAAARVLPQLR